MGNKLFGIDVASIVSKSIGPGVLPVTLYIYPDIARGGRLTDGFRGDPEIVSGARGIWEDYNPSQIGTQIRANDRRALLIGDTIPDGKLPKIGDEIEISGSRLYVIRLEGGDPAEATYRYQCGDRRGLDGK